MTPTTRKTGPCAATAAHGAEAGTAASARRYVTGERHVNHQTTPGGLDWCMSMLVGGGPDAEIPLSEGFCPLDLTALAGDARNWCPQCKTYWHLVTAEVS